MGVFFSLKFSAYADWRFEYSADENEFPQIPQIPQIDLSWHKFYNSKHFWQYLQAFASGSYSCFYIINTNLTNNVSVHENIVWQR